jgi:hypothetical protein
MNTPVAIPISLETVQSLVIQIFTPLAKLDRD